MCLLRYFVVTVVCILSFISCRNDKDDEDMIRYFLNQSRDDRFIGIWRYADSESNIYFQYDEDGRCYHLTSLQNPSVKILDCYWYTVNNNQMHEYYSKKDKSKVNYYYRIDGDSLFIGSNKPYCIRVSR